MHESARQTNPIEDTYTAVEERVYANGAHHLYGINAETGKKEHISFSQVAEAYGHDLGQPSEDEMVDSNNEVSSEAGMTDQERLVQHAKWQLNVNTTGTKPSERGLTGDDLAYNAWLNENATTTTAPTLRQKIAQDAEKARLDSMREFARLEMRVKTGAASGEEAAYYYGTQEKGEETELKAFFYAEADAAVESAQNAESDEQYGMAVNRAKNAYRGLEALAGDDWNISQRKAVISEFKKRLGPLPSKKVADANLNGASKPFHEELRGMLDDDASLDQEQAQRIDVADQKLTDAINMAGQALRDNNGAANQEYLEAEEKINEALGHLKTEYGKDWTDEHHAKVVDWINNKITGNDIQQSPDPDVEKQPKSAEQTEMDYQAELDELRAALREVNNRPNTDKSKKEELERIMSRMHGLISQQIGTKKGRDEDWARQELIAQKDLARNEEEWANAGAFKRAKIRFDKWRNNPENEGIKRALVVGTVVGAVALAGILLGTGGDDSSEKPKANRPIVTTTVPNPSTTSTTAGNGSNTNPGGGEAVANHNTVKLSHGKTPSHFALDRLSAQGVLSQDRTTRLQQIQNETQRILDLNHLSWEQARHLADNTELKT